MKYIIYVDHGNTNMYDLFWTGEKWVINIEQSKIYHHKEECIKFLDKIKTDKKLQPFAPVGSKTTYKEIE